MPSRKTIGTLQRVPLPTTGEHKNKGWEQTRLDKAAAPADLCEGWVWWRGRLS